MENVLDLRGTPTWERHQLVCSAFSTLRQDDTLQLIYDYEPRPLRKKFEDIFSQGYVWAQRRVAAQRWEIRLRKLAQSAGEGSLSHFLGRTAVFSRAADATRGLLAPVAQPRTVRRKTTIVQQESDWPYLGIVRRGRIFAIVGTPLGREQILFEVLETEVFGNMVLFDGGATIARFATLAEPAEVLLFPRSTVLRAAEADARFALALAAASTQQTRAIVELVEAHVSKKTIVRVADALMAYAPAEEGLAAVDPSHLPSLRLTQIAVATGTVKEVVARAVAELEQTGVIRRANGRIAYIDRARLRDLTQQLDR